MNFTTPLLTVGLLSAFTIEAAPNSRFDGTWVGKEEAIPPLKMGSGYDRFVPLPKKVTVVIAQGGALVGYLTGNCPGRYDNVQLLTRLTRTRAPRREFPYSIGGNTKRLYMTYSNTDC